MQFGSVAKNLLDFSRTEKTIKKAARVIVLNVVYDALGTEDNSP